MARAESYIARSTSTRSISTPKSMRSLVTEGYLRSRRRPACWTSARSSVIGKRWKYHRSIKQAKVIHAGKNRARQTSFGRKGTRGGYVDHCRSLRKRGSVRPLSTHLKAIMTMWTMLPSALHQARRREYNSSPAPSAKKRTKRRKKRGPIMTARRNQNLITFTPCLRHREPLIDVRRRFLMCLQPKCTKFQTSVPRIGQRIAEISGSWCPPPSSRWRLQLGFPGDVTSSSVPAK